MRIRPGIVDLGPKSAPKPDVAKPKMSRAMSTNRNKPIPIDFCEASVCFHHDPKLFKLRYISTEIRMVECHLRPGTPSDPAKPQKLHRIETSLKMVGNAPMLSSTKNSTYNFKVRQLGRGHAHLHRRIHDKVDVVPALEHGHKP